MDSVRDIKFYEIISRILVGVITVSSIRRGGFDRGRAISISDNNSEETKTVTAV